MLLHHCDVPILQLKGNHLRDGIHRLHILQVEIAFSPGLGREGDRSQHARPAWSQRGSIAETAEENRPRLVVDLRAEGAGVAPRASQEAT